MLHFYSLEKNLQGKPYSESGVENMAVGEGELDALNG